MTSLLHLRLEAVAASVPLARAAVTDICAPLGLSAALTDSIRLAVTEACTNVVRHAYRDHDDGNAYYLDADLDRGVLLIVVRDMGVGIQLQDAAAQESSLGMGIHLIARMAMSTDIAALPGCGTRVAMRFALT